MSPLPDRLRESTFFRFFIVGSMGFLVDGGFLQSLIWLFHLSPIWARVPSFSAAVLATWYLNRNFTFRTPDRTFLESFPAYLLSSAVGLGINFGVYSVGVLNGVIPLAALAVASIAAMFFNFAMAKFFVFGKKTQ